MWTATCKLENHGQDLIIPSLHPFLPPLPSFSFLEKKKVRQDRTHFIGCCVHALGISALPEAVSQEAVAGLVSATVFCTCHRLSFASFQTSLCPEFCLKSGVCWGLAVCSEVRGVGNALSPCSEPHEDTKTAVALSGRACIICSGFPGIPPAPASCLWHGFLCPSLS